MVSSSGWFNRQAAKEKSRKDNSQDEMRYLYYSSDMDRPYSGDFSEGSAAVAFLYGDQKVPVAYTNNSPSPPENVAEAKTLVWSGKASDMEYMGKLSDMKWLGTAKDINKKLKKALKPIDLSP